MRYGSATSNPDLVAPCGHHTCCDLPVETCPTPNQFKLIKANHECRSGDASLGSYFSTVDGCAEKCRQTEGCRFFIYGIDAGPQGNKGGKCYHEKTSGAACSEGWESDSYDFYEVLSCFKDLGEGIPGCKCHASCAMCGYTNVPTDANDCITCADGGAVVSVYPDGTGTCPGSSKSSSGTGKNGSLAIIVPVVVAAVLLVAAVLFLVRKRAVAARQPHRDASMPNVGDEDEVQA